MAQLFVGGFPLEIHEIELAQLFSTYGDVVTIKIIRDRATKICKGYGFIEMVTREAADAAIQALDGTLMEGRELSVRMVDEEKKPYPSNTRLSQAPVYQKVERGISPDKKHRPKRPRLGMK